MSAPFVHTRIGRWKADFTPSSTDLPDGNSKFSTFEVDTRVPGKPVVNVRVMIDGEEAWKLEIQGKPLATPPPPQGVGALGKSLLELLGFKRRTWF